MDYRVLLPKDAEEVLAFARLQHNRSASDPMEAELSSWTARWRGESLEHYLALGWSYGAWDQGVMQGFVLSQPFLFFRGRTQSLWVEQVVGQSDTLRQALMDLVCRWARDKRFQVVVMDDGDPRGPWREINTTRSVT
jgi:hypothetical protein